VQNTQSSWQKQQEGSALLAFAQLAALLLLFAVEFEGFGGVKPTPFCVVYICVGSASQVLLLWQQQASML
jgi:hypothetical protein